MLLLPIAYKQHPMVQHPGVTLWLPVHTGAVELERLVAGVNGDAARSLGCNGVHQLHLIPRLNINKPDICGSFPPWVVAALVILSFIGVAPLCVNAPILLDILEGIVHQAPIAPLIPIRSAAVHQVLLAQAHQLSCLPEVHRLQSPCGGERPTGSTLTLVLDWCHSA